MLKTLQCIAGGYGHNMRPCSVFGRSDQDEDRQNEGKDKQNRLSGTSTHSGIGRIELLSCRGDKIVRGDIATRCQCGRH